MTSMIGAVGRTTVERMLLQLRALWLVVALVGLVVALLASEGAIALPWGLAVVLIRIGTSQAHEVDRELKKMEE